MRSDNDMYQPFYNTEKYSNLTVTKLMCEDKVWYNEGAIIDPTTIMCVDMTPTTTTTTTTTTITTTTTESSGDGSGDTCECVCPDVDGSGDGSGAGSGDGSGERSGASEMLSDDEDDKFYR